MNEQISRFMARTILYHGFGAVRLAGAEAKKCGITKAMLISDPGVRRAGILKQVEESLKASTLPYEIYDNVQEDADVETVHQIALRIRESGCNGVVVVGGGSAMCAAKGAALESANGVQSIRELEGLNRYIVPPLPVVCLPTTAGSGTDVSWGFPIVDKTHGREFSIAGEHIQPPVSILDPLLLKTCPRWPMIYAGLDALSHAVEALWGARATVITDAFAFEAIRLIMNNLRGAALTEDTEAKSTQLLASVMANFAGGNASLGIVHGIAVSIGNLKGPHGFKCGMLLPFGIEFNLPVCEEKFARIAAMLGSGTSGKSYSTSAHDFIDHVKQLLMDLDFPPKFGPENLTKERIPDLIKEVRRHTPCFLDTNLRKVTDDDVMRICESALKGWA